MLKKILLVLAIIIVGICIAAAFQPDSYTVERTATIAASQELVFEQANNLRNGQRFNPWADADPNAVYTYDGPDNGVGATYHWKGNSDMGEGRMTILESRPIEYVKMDLSFIEPFEGKAITEFELAPVSGGTRLTQRMTSEHNFFSKIMCLFMDMDQMVGEKFEEGFARMNKVLPSLEVDPQ